MCKGYRELGRDHQDATKHRVEIQEPLRIDVEDPEVSDWNSRSHQRQRDRETERERERDRERERERESEREHLVQKKVSHLLGSFARSTSNIL